MGTVSIRTSYCQYNGWSNNREPWYPWSHSMYVAHTVVIIHVMSGMYIHRTHGQKCKIQHQVPTTYIVLLETGIMKSQNFNSHLKKSAFYINEDLFIVARTRYRFYWWSCILTWKITLRHNVWKKFIFTCARWLWTKRGKKSSTVKCPL